jgi:hypothetical protein
LQDTGVRTLKAWQDELAEPGAVINSPSRHEPWRAGLRSGK